MAEVNARLSERGLLMRQSTVVDATIIAAPSSTKDEDGKRDPEMSQAEIGDHDGRVSRLEQEHTLDRISGKIRRSHPQPLWLIADVLP